MAHRNHIVLRLAGPLCLLVITVGCSASPSHSGILPLGPTPFASSASAMRAGTQAYDATGIWRLVITDQRSGEVYDDVETELIQQPNGTITFCGECEGEQFTLIPKGANQGAALPYALTYFGEGEPCNASATGSAVLDTRNSAIKAHGVHVITDDCSRLLVSIVLTRRP